MNVHIFQLTSINTEIKIHINPIYFSQNINDNFQSLEKKFKEIHDFVEDMKKPKNSEFISEKIIEIKSDIESLVSMILPEMGYLPKNFFDDGTRHYNDYYDYSFMNNSMLLIKEKYIKLTEILTIITYLIKENFGALNTRQKMLSLANEIFKKIYSEYIEDESNIKYNLNLYNWLDYYEVIPNSYSSQYFGVRKVDKNKDFLLENLNKFYENNQKKIYQSILSIGIEYGRNSNKIHEMFLMVRNRSIKDWLKFEDELQECQKIVESYTNNTTKLLQNK